MKMIKFFAVALAATAMLASCSKEDTGNGPVNGGGAKVVLDIKGTGAETRVDGPSLGAVGLDKAKLGVGLFDVSIFIIDENDAVITRAYAAGDANIAALKTSGVTTTTAARNVVVVANVGSDLTTGGGKFNVPTLAALKKVTMSLNEAVVLTKGTSLEETSSTNRILLQGQTETELSFDSDNKADAGKILVFPVPARLNVTVINRMTKGGSVAATASDWAEGYVAFDSVAVLYSAANIYAVPTVSGSETGTEVYKNYDYRAAVPATYAASYYVSGYDPGATDEWSVLEDGSGNSQNALATGSAATNGYLGRVWAPNTGAGAGTGSASFNASNDFQGTFYALPSVATAGTKTVYPTITVIGTYDQDGAAGSDYAPERRYWHVKMSTTDAAAQLMESGRAYNILITLKGDILSGGGGVKDPDDEVVGGTVVLEVEAAGWQSVAEINKIYE